MVWVLVSHFLFYLQIISSCVSWHPTSCLCLFSTLFAVYICVSLVHLPLCIKACDFHFLLPKSAPQSCSHLVFYLHFLYRFACVAHVICTLYSFALALFFVVFLLPCLCYLIYSFSSFMGGVNCKWSNITNLNMSPRAWRNCDQCFCQFNY